MTALRSLAFNLVFYLLLITMLIVGLPVLLGGTTSVKRYAALWARISFRLLSSICGVELEVRGIENVPQGGCIVASKHQSFLDIIALVPLLPRFVFVLKRELMAIPLFGRFLRKAGMIPIDRAGGRAIMSDLTKRVKSAVQNDLQLIIFPEGTRRSPGAEPLYKTGVSHLYAGADVPCVPVALNSGLFWPRHGFLHPPGRLIVEFLPPIPPGMERSAMLAELQRRIEAASNDLLVEGRATIRASRATAPAT